jgi:preprotein translocase subunit SecD
MAVYVAVKADDVDVTGESRVITSPDGESLVLATAPLFTQADILSASLDQATDGRPAVRLVLSEDAAEQMRSSADDYVNQHLAFVSEGKVLSAPMVMSPMGRQLMVVGGTSRFPDDAVLELIEKLNALAGTSD